MIDDIYYYDFSKKGKDVLGNQIIPILKNDQAVRESIINLLSTEVGSRIMNPELGLLLDRYLFDPIDSITADKIHYDIVTAIEKFENRIENLVIEVNPYEELQTFIIDITFDIKYSNKTETIQINFNKIR